MTGTTPAAWSDPTRGGELARSQFDRGADVVYAAAGATGLGVLQAAKDRGRLAIGVDSNQNHLYPGTMLTSMVKRVDLAVYEAFKTARDGTWKAGVRNLGLAEAGVGWALDQHNRSSSPRRWSAAWSRRARTSSPGASRSPTPWRGSPEGVTRSRGASRLRRGVSGRWGYGGHAGARRARDRGPRRPQVVRRGPRQPRRLAGRPRGHDPRAGGRERRRQVHADGDALWVSPAGSRRDPGPGRRGGLSHAAGRPGRRHRHGAPALHAGGAVHGAGERRAGRGGRVPARGGARARPCAARAPGGGLSPGGRSGRRRGRPRRGPAPARRDPQGAGARRRSPDPRRADRRAHAAGGGRLFRILRSLRDEGKTVILVTHKLREVLDLADAVTVMRQGRVVATLPIAGTTAERLAALMVGRDVRLRVDSAPCRAGEPVLEVRGLVVRDALGVERVRGVDISVRRGEIVGIAGVAGNGQSELLEAIAGLRPAASGRIVVMGRPADGVSPRDLRQLGLCHVPEDRARMLSLSPSPPLRFSISPLFQITD